MADGRGDSESSPMKDEGRGYCRRVRVLRSERQRDNWRGTTGEKTSGGTQNDGRTMEEDGRNDAGGPA